MKLKVSEMSADLKKKEIAQAVVHRRKVLGIRQQDLADLVDITTRYLYEVEKGKANPSLETLTRIFDALGLTLEIKIKQPGE